MLRPLLVAVNPWRRRDRLPLGLLVTTLGERSFGWAILLFALVNLLPMPLGSTVVTAIPLILLTSQMVYGMDHVWLPQAVARRRVSCAGLRRVAHRLHPLIRPVEAIVRKRHGWVFERRCERVLGGALLVIAITLFIPIPLSGWFSAISLVVAAIGLIAEDGLVTLLGLGGGAATIVLSCAVAAGLAMGAASLF
jgi:hypothetical protein